MSAIKHFLSNPAEVRKSVAAFLGCVLLGVSAHVLPSEVGAWIQVAQPILIALGVYHIPNLPAAAPAPETPAAPPAA